MGDKAATAPVDNIATQRVLDNISPTKRSFDMFDMQRLMSITLEKQTVAEIRP